MSETRNDQAKSQEKTLRELEWRPLGRTDSLRWYAARNDECAAYWRKQAPSWTRDYQLHRHERQASELRVMASTAEG